MLHNARQTYPAHGPPQRSLLMAEPHHASPPFERLVPLAQEAFDARRYNAAYHLLSAALHEGKVMDNTTSRYSALRRSSEGGLTGLTRRRLRRAADDLEACAPIDHHMNPDGSRVQEWLHGVLNARHDLLGLCHARCTWVMASLAWHHHKGGIGDQVKASRPSRKKTDRVGWCGAGIYGNTRGRRRLWQSSVPPTSPLTATAR